MQRCGFNTKIVNEDCIDPFLAVPSWLAAYRDIRGQDAVCRGGQRVSMNSANVPSCILHPASFSGPHLLKRAVVDPCAIWMPG